MPIWDEEWWVRNSPACTDDIYCEEAKYIFTGLRAIGQPGFEDARARAKLAAAAPAMARLLLSLEWEWDMDRGIDLCPVCGNEKPWLAFDDQDGEPKGGHAPDCRWLAVMRAAGVRE